jgi:hypothetical protein
VKSREEGKVVLVDVIDMWRDLSDKILLRFSHALSLVSSQRTLELRLPVYTVTNCYCTRR